MSPQSNNKSMHTSLSLARAHTHTSRTQADTPESWPYLVQPDPRQAELRRLLCLHSIRRFLVHPPRERVCIREVLYSYIYIYVNVYKVI